VQLDLHQAQHQLEHRMKEKGVFIPLEKFFAAATEHLVERQAERGAGMALTKGLEHGVEKGLERGVEGAAKVAMRGGEAVLDKGFVHGVQHALSKGLEHGVEKGLERGVEGAAKVAMRGGEAALDKGFVHGAQHALSKGLEHGVEKGLERGVEGAATVAMRGGEAVMDRSLERGAEHLAERLVEEAAGRGAERTGATLAARGLETGSAHMAGRGVEGAVERGAELGLLKAAERSSERVAKRGAVEAGAAVERSWLLGGTVAPRLAARLTAGLLLAVPALGALLIWHMFTNDIERVAAASDLMDGEKDATPQGNQLAHGELPHAAGNSDCAQAAAESHSSPAQCFHDLVRGGAVFVTRTALPGRGVHRPTEAGGPSKRGDEAERGRPAGLLASATLGMFLTAAVSDLLDVGCHLLTVLGILQMHFSIHTGVGHHLLHSVESLGVVVAVVATLAAVVGEVMFQMASRQAVVHTA